MLFLGFKLFPIDVNAAGRVENHCPKITEVPLLTSENTVQYSAAASGEMATNNPQPLEIPVHLELSTC